MPVARCDSIEIYYETHGDPAAEPLVLIMGISGTVETWEYQIPSLSESFYLVAFDHRGAGRSDKPPGPYRMAALAADTRAVMDALGIEAAHLFGVDMGGMIAQQLAIETPERVRRLVLGATACSLPRPELWLLGVMNAYSGRSREQLIRESLAFSYSRAWAEGHPEGVEAAVRQAMSNGQPLHGYQGQLSAMLEHNSCTRLGQVEAPTLILHGTHDLLFAPGCAIDLAERIPHARLEWIEGAGHLFFHEQPELVNALVADFLRSPTAPAP